MNEAKNENLFIRVSEKEKTIIAQNAKKCGLSVSEYLRQRALGEMPEPSFSKYSSHLMISWTNSVSLSRAKSQRIRKKK